MAALLSPCLFPQQPCRSRSSYRLLVYARKKRIKPKDLSKQRDFEDGMMVWDDVFEKCCEDPIRAGQLVEVSAKGMEMHGRGCVLVREATSCVTKGAGTGFINRARSLVPTARPSFYRSCDWSVSYVPRAFIVDPTLAPSDVNDPAIEQKVNGPQQEDEILVRRTDLLPVLRAMDRTRVLSLTTERILRDSISLRAVQADDNEQDAGGEECYNPLAGEMVLLLSVEFDGRPIVGADVLQAQQLPSSSKTNKWRLKMRDYNTMF